MYDPVYKYTYAYICMHIYTYKQTREESQLAHQVMRCRTGQFPSTAFYISYICILFIYIHIVNFHQAHFIYIICILYRYIYIYILYKYIFYLHSEFASSASFCGGYRTDRCPSYILCLMPHSRVSGSYR